MVVYRPRLGGFSCTCTPPQNVEASNASVGAGVKVRMGRWWGGAQTIEFVPEVVVLVCQRYSRCGRTAGSGAPPSPLFCNSWLSCGLLSCSMYDVYLSLWEARVGVQPLPVQALCSSLLLLEVPACRLGVAILCALSTRWLVWTCFVCLPARYHNVIARTRTVRLSSISGNPLRPDRSSD